MTKSLNNMPLNIRYVEVEKNGKTPNDRYII